MCCPPNPARFPHRLYRRAALPRLPFCRFSLSLHSSHRRVWCLDFRRPLFAPGFQSAPSFCLPLLLTPADFLLVRSSLHRFLLPFGPTPWHSLAQVVFAALTRLPRSVWPAFAFHFSPSVCCFLACVDLRPFALAFRIGVHIVSSLLCPFRCLARPLSVSPPPDVCFAVLCVQPFLGAHVRPGPSVGRSVHVVASSFCTFQATASPPPHALCPSPLRSGRHPRPQRVALSSVDATRIALPAPLSFACFPLTCRAVIHA